MDRKQKMNALDDIAAMPSSSLWGGMKIEQHDTEGG